jgi:ubiquinone biosynthesis protein Coq4
MGNKTYFEFLEEEFQVLTSELQKSLAKISSIADHSSDFNSNNNNNNNNNTNNNNDEMVAATAAGKQLTRCQAIIQQLRTECKGDTEFKDRLSLYKIQLETLRLELERYT